MRHKAATNQKMKSPWSGNRRLLHTRRWEFIPYRLSIIYNMYFVQIYCIFYKTFYAENGKIKCRIPT